MSVAPVIVAMWSGPRNLSTALMYAFANRADCVAWDEPFYAAYLEATGLDHPLREEIVAAYETDPAAIARRCLEPPAGARVFYQKHMTHHMLDAFPRDWTDGIVNAFLIRRPEAVVASYEVKRREMALDDLGFVRQRELFERTADRLGHAPPVVDADAIRADPDGTLRRLCAALAIPFDPAMLGWEAGPRACDGLWARHWYDAVHRSTGFAKPGSTPPLTAAQAALAEAAQPFYEVLARFAL
jgi:hypothetical protein